jgi:hypothetical protein
MYIYNPYESDTDKQLQNAIYNRFGGASTSDELVIIFTRKHSAWNCMLSLKV